MEAKKDLEEKVRRLRLQFERNQQELQRYKEAGAEELKKLKSENQALRQGLTKVEKECGEAIRALERKENNRRRKERDEKSLYSKCHSRLMKNSIKDPHLNKWITQFDSKTIIETHKRQPFYELCTSLIDSLQANSAEKNRIPTATSTELEEELQSMSRMNLSRNSRVTHSGAYLFKGRSMMERVLAVVEEIMEKDQFSVYESSLAKVRVFTSLCNLLITQHQQDISQSDLIERARLLVQHQVMSIDRPGSVMSQRHNPISTPSTLHQVSLCTTHRNSKMSAQRLHSLETEGEDSLCQEIFEKCREKGDQLNKTRTARFRESTENSFCLQVYKKQAQDLRMTGEEAITLQDVSAGSSEEMNPYPSTILEDCTREDALTSGCPSNYGTQQKQPKLQLVNEREPCHEKQPSSDLDLVQCSDGISIHQFKSSDASQKDSQECSSNKNPSFLPPVMSQTSSQYSSVTSRNPRSSKYETLGGVQHRGQEAGHTQKVNLVSFTQGLQDDGTPAFGKKCKSVINELNEREFYDTQKNFQTESGSDIGKTSLFTVEDKSGIVTQRESIKDNEDVGLDFTQISSISQISSLIHDAQKMSEMNITLKPPPLNLKMLHSNTSQESSDRAENTKKFLKAFRERNRSCMNSQQIEMSMDSQRSVQTARQFSCDQVIKYSVIGKLDTEKRRMSGHFEERKPSRARTGHSVPTSVARRVCRTDDKQNRWK